MQTDNIAIILDLTEKFKWCVGEPYNPDDYLPPHEYEAGEMTWSSNKANLIGYKNYLKKGISNIIAATDTKSAEKPIKKLLGLLNEYLNNPNVPEFSCNIRWEMRGIIKDLFSCLPDEFIPTNNTEETTKGLPNELFNPKTMQIWNAAINAGLVDDVYKPIMNKVERAFFADLFAETFGLNNKWAPFESFWGDKNLAQVRYKSKEIYCTVGKRGKVIEGIFDSYISNNQQK